MVEGREVEDFKEALKWLTAELAPARDLDVLINEAIAPLREAEADKPEVALLERDAKVLKELQGYLGKLNDIRVHDQKARCLANRREQEPAQAEKAYAMGLLTGREQRLAEGLVSAAQKAGRQLSRTPTFW
jgi:hypothetical protein